VKATGYRLHWNWGYRLHWNWRLQATLKLKLIFCETSKLSRLLGHYFLDFLIFYKLVDMVIKVVEFLEQKMWVIVKLYIVIEFSLMWCKTVDQMVLYELTEGLTITRSWIWAQTEMGNLKKHDNQHISRILTSRFMHRVLCWKVKCSVEGDNVPCNPLNPGLNMPRNQCGNKPCDFRNIPTAGALIQNAGNMHSFCRMMPTKIDAK